MDAPTKPIDDLENIDVTCRAELERGEAIACLLTTNEYGQVWMRVGTVAAVSEDGTIVVYDDDATTAAGGRSWFVSDDWIARWPE